MKQSVKKNWTYVFPVLLFLTFLILLFRVSSSVGAATQKEERENLERALVQSCVHCYCVEGEYPQSLSYLKEHYGITWDPQKYRVEYRVIAKNLRPEIKIHLVDRGKKNGQ
ncbi:MAG: hypothetical protein MR867_06975 [Eubacterium sp.]|nr:hypothetical protein [Eubacterium sp.]MDD7208944.1 hypothetical protein [Lachnospiraceae bacterium]MDY5496593.1 hypothetical protein [Anaerobutyricum sp.]